jgi:hypothetical protein
MTDKIQPSNMAVKKALLMIEEQGFRIDGLLLRKDAKLAIITNLGRVEAFNANEHGGIQQPEPDPATIDEIHRARDVLSTSVHNDDDFKVDDDALVSRADAATWVQAWVRLEDEGRNLCSMHEWEHHEEIRRHYKRKRFEIVDSELVGNISYYLVYHASWPKGLRFHYMSAHPDFSCAYDSMAEVGQPFQQWFIDAMNRYSEKNKSCA